MRFTRGEPKGLDGIIDCGCSIDGKLSFKGGLRLNGKFNGKIEGDGVLLIGREGRVQADIQVDELVVEGEVEGTVCARTKVSVHDGGKLIADVETDGFVIEKGGIFSGKSSMQMAETIELKTKEKKTKKAN